jgi:ketosteroid isomerase-like protein
MPIHLYRARALILLLLLLLLLVVPLASADIAADRAAIEASAQAWMKAFNARHIDALIATTTEDVVLMDPNMPPLTGRKAARDAWQLALRNSKGQIATVTKELHIAGDLAWRIAAFTHKTPHELMPNGQALEIWRSVDGKWKLHRQMSSTILAEPKLLQPRPSEPVLDRLEQPKH